MKLPSLKRSLLPERMFAGLLVLLCACVDPYVASVIQEDHNILVIDGFLIPNDTTVIKLSRTNPIYSKEGLEPETNALVEIEGNDGVSYQLIEKKSGTYVIPPLNLDPAREYRLHVRTGDTEEYASEFVGIKNTHQIDSVAFEEIAECDALEFYVYSHDPEGKTRYYLWTYDETFEYVSEETLKGKLITDRYDDVITQEFLGYIVLTEYCIDCRKRGGINIKPEFWN